MLSLLKIFDSPIGIIALGVVGVLFGVWMVYERGHYDGVESERAATRQAIIDQLKERSETDAEIRDMDIPELCDLLGGSMSDDGECL